MASIRKIWRKRKNRHVYEVRWRELDGQHKSLVYKNREEAEKFSRDIQRIATGKRNLQIADDTGVKIDSNLTVKSLMERYIAWAEEGNKAEPTVESYRLTLAQFPKDIQGMKAGKIRPDRLERYKRESLSKVSKRTVNLRLLGLSAAYRWGIEQGLVRSNPTRKVKPYKITSEPARVLSQEEINALYEAANPFQRVILTISLSTLCRAGEIERMEFRDVNIRAKTLTIRESKTGRNHTVPLTDVAVQEFKRLEKIRISQRGRRHQRQLNQKRFIFCQTDGTIYPRRNQVVSKTMRSLGEKAEVLKFHHHLIRSTGATAIAAEGGGPHMVRGMLGHKGLEMSLRYVSLSPNDLVPAADTLEKAIPKGLAAGLRLIDGDGELSEGG